MSAAADTGTGTRLVADRVYSRAGGRDRLADLYIPEGDGPFPAIIFLHGGGWRFGDRKLAPDLRRFFADDGFVMVSIDYRLSGEAIFPAAVIDTRTAIRWLRSHAAEYNIDPDWIGLWGSSAGGHLAAMAALSNADEFASGEWTDASSKVAAVMEGYGPTDFLQIDAQKGGATLPGEDPESAKLPPPGPSAAPDSLESLFVGGAISEQPERVGQASPVNYADGASCPFLIMHGTYDAHVRAGQSRLLFDALSAAGAQAELIEIEGLGHGFLNRNDLDDAGPHKALTYRSATPDQAERGEIRIFDTILQFFRREMTG
ncbi:alpha/beta hydrolase [Paracoccus aurantiacus]|uniref:Alpha/beta hydrolase n=1 Tax=Paracoccus aurantiacus TaxID=2599412 RepID=A0A5C6RYG2_9RHOB|nr:alpha/beta hydrolase [Paracoccus aurantiacus]TXB67428.1 alpha/beta hydrolase [Paracoccus aurantiacus]